MSDYILELINVSKEFPGVRALDNVNLQIKKGEIHAIVGENGAGKSTMMKIISGVYPKGTYTGSIVLEGIEKHFSGIKDSEKEGIAIIYQELALVKMMNITENIFLGNEFKNKFGVIDWNKAITCTKKILEQVGIDVIPTMQVINLGIGQQQLVEIAKALSKNAKLLILDEPTAALTESEAENLFQILKKLRNNGVTCIFITHRLQEVFKICDRVTVIRDGKSIATQDVSNVTEDKIISLMVGRDMDERFPKVKHTAGDIIMEVKNWNVRDPELPSRKLIDNVNFKLYKSEILGISGLMGAGRTELAMSLFGCFKGYTSGEMMIDGKTVHIKEPKDAIALGISYLSEDRKQYGFNMLMDIEDNITMAALKSISNYGIIDNNRKAINAIKYIKEMKIKTPSSKQMVVSLSGGNQQKVVLGKWLMTDPKVLILDEPTRGIDVGAKYEIYDIINDLIKKGVSIILISSELPEILGMSDRILVMHEGKLTGELDASQADQETIMLYATGGGRQ
jgi:ABC-type sugar transport system ATPase subunit